MNGLDGERVRSLRPVFLDPTSIGIRKFKLEIECAFLNGIQKHNEEEKKRDHGQARPKCPLSASYLLLPSLIVYRGLVYDGAYQLARENTEPFSSWHAFPATRHLFVALIASPKL